jgi:hypothetical protein
MYYIDAFRVVQHLATQPLHLQFSCTAVAERGKQEQYDQATVLHGFYLPEKSKNKEMVLA